MLRAQQWNSQIWLNGWYKASVSRGGDAKRALLTKVFTHNLDIFRDGAYRTESDRVVTLPVGGAFVENSEMFSAPVQLGTVFYLHGIWWSRGIILRYSIWQAFIIREAAC